MPISIYYHGREATAGTRTASNNFERYRYRYRYRYRGIGRYAPEDAYARGLAVRKERKKRAAPGSP